MKSVASSWVNGISEHRRPEDVQYFVDAINQVDLKSAPYEEIKLVVTYALRAIAKSQKDWNLNKIFRAVKKTEREIIYPEDLLAPPVSIVKHFGRLHKPGHPVFYGAEKSIVPIWEVRADVGEHVYLIHLEPKNENPILILDLGVYETLCADYMGYEKRDSIRSSLKSLLENENMKFLEVILSFVNEEITRPISENENWKYKVSAAISEVLWRDPKTHTALFYPSVTRGLKGLNVAFEPQFVKENYFPRGIQEVEILEKGLERIRYRTHRYGDGEDEYGKIKWVIGDFKERLIE